MGILWVNKNDIQSYNDDNYWRNKEYFKSQPGMMKEMAQYAKDNLARIKKDEEKWEWIDSDFKRELELFLVEYEKIETETKISVKQASDDLDIEKTWKKEISKQSKNEKIENYNFSTINTLSNNLKSLDWLNANDKLIVSIKDDNSRLRLRDGNLKIISTLNQKTEVTYTGKNKEVDWKTFVEVSSWDKKWWVALWYLRKEVAKAPTEKEPVIEGKTSVQKSPETKKIPEIKEKSPDKYSESVNKIQNQFDAWKKITKESEWVLNEEEIKNNLESINTIYAELAASIIDFEKKYIKWNTENPYEKQNLEWIKSIYNEIAMYNRWETESYFSMNGPNKNFRNPELAEQLLLASLPKQKTNPPKKPDINDIIDSLDTPTKTLFSAFIKKEQEKSWISFEEAFTRVLSNPTIKWAWNKVNAKLAEWYGKEMEKYINWIDEKSLSVQELKAYEQLKDMYWTGGIFDLKDSTKVSAIMWREQLLALWAWIAWVAFVSTWIWAIWWWALLAYSAWILAWWVIMTWANMALEQKTLSWKDFAFETAVNSWTFVVWWLIFKVARSWAVISKLWSKWAIWAEMWGDLSLWISIDQIRANHNWIDISVWESLKNNLPWALLPLVSWKMASWFSKVRQDLAKKTQDWLNEANIKQNLGDSEGASAVLKNIDEEVSVARNAENSPKKIDSEKLNSLEIWKKIKIWEKYITRTKDWKLSYDWKKYDNPDELVNVVNWRKTETTKVESWNEKVETKSKAEYLKKIGEISTLKWKEIYSNIKSKLSSSWKEKLEKTYKESDFIKDFKENLWAKIEKDYEWFRFISWTFKAPISTVVFLTEQTWKRLLMPWFNNTLSPAWQISTALNPIKMHQNLTWTQKIFGSLTASAIYESISQWDEPEKSIWSKESAANILTNAPQLATVWFWTIATEPLINTLYWKFKWFEPRDFLPAYINNLWVFKPMPYELWESLVLNDKHVLEKTLKAFLDSWDYKETDYEIIELRKRLKELETK